MPVNLYFAAWNSDADNRALHNVIGSAASSLEYYAQNEGVYSPDIPRYPNYALDGTALETMYGDNVGILGEIKAKYDPQNVMGLAGGWKF